MSAFGRNDLIADLVTLKYDLAADLYRQRAKAQSVVAASHKDGNPWEYAAYKIFGSDRIGGLALWLDPFWQFKRNVASKDAQTVYLTTVVPVNRTRTRCTLWSCDIYADYKNYQNSSTSNAKWTGSKYIQGPWTSAIPRVVTQHVFKGHQAPLYGFISDTTYKSRNPGKRIKRKMTFEKRSKEYQSQGELEIWDPHFDSKPFSSTVESKNYNWAPFGTGGLATIGKSSNKSVFSLSGASATIDPSDVTAVLGAERAYARYLMNKHAAALVADCLVTRRRFNIGYQVGELKDLPQMLRGTVAVYRDIEHLIGWEEFKKALTIPSWWSPKNVERLGPWLDKLLIANRPDKAISGAYLTFKFGYQSLYQAVDQLLKTPAKIANDVNIICEANGKFQTFRRKRMFPIDEWTGPPDVTFQIPYPCSPDLLRPISNVGTREAELRVVVESGVRLPDVVTPTLRKKLYYEKLGWPLRPSDIYNLIPWTWLGDWILSVNDYLKLLEEIHMDKSLINWGLITYESKLKAKASVGIYTDTTDVTVISPAPTNTVACHHTYCLESEFSAKYQLRADIASLANVNLPSGKGLSQTQGSILSALISQFT